MSLKLPLSVTVLLLTFQQSFSQHRVEEYNFLGISGGYVQFDIITDNFVTEQSSGFTGGFSTRGSVYNRLDLIYGVAFFNTDVGILGRDLANPANNFNEQFVDYTLQSAQIKLLASINFIRHSLTLEAGPILNVNGRMKLKRSGFEDYTLDGFENLKASDIENVSRVNLRVTGGLSTGIRNFRLGAHYQYGVTNLFNRFNDNENIEQPKDDGEFEGHTSTLVFSAVIYF